MLATVCCAERWVKSDEHVKGVLDWVSEKG